MSFATAAFSEPAPIIDVHLHAEPVASYGPPGQKFCMEMLSHVPPLDPTVAPIAEALTAWQMAPGCPDEMQPAESDEALMAETLAVLKKRNIIGIVSGVPEILAKWVSAAPDHVIPAHQFSLGRDDETPEELAGLYDDGHFKVLAEVTNQYRGYAPDAPEFDAYWEMAEENDIPVGIHIGVMPPGSAYMINGSARVSIGDPLLLEEILVRHPRLRVYIMHAGMPLFDRTIALMLQYPQVYAETGVLQAVMTREAYEAFLADMINAGLGKRLMYGTDQMIWPGMIERSLRLVEKSKVLTGEQKRDILYNNAARFFRLDAASN